MKNLCFKLILGLTSLLLFSSKGFAQAPTATVSTTAAPVCGVSNGTATVTASGGNGTYTYHWYPSQLTTATITGQPAGSGTVSVISGTDSVTLPFTIAGAASITATRDSFCLASADTLTATAAGATSYAWSGGTLTGTSTANPLYVTASTGGTYTYTVTTTDGTGCTASASKTVVAYNVSAVLVLPVTQPTCGRNNGEIRVSVQYGTAFVAEFYQGAVLIQSGVNLTLSNLLPGTYSFLLRDISSGCTAAINNIVLVDATNSATFNSVVNNPVTCFGQQNGSIFVTVGNCTSGCVYNWSHDAANHTDSAVNLAAGTYIFSVTSGGCSTIADTIVVAGPSSALIDTLIIHPDQCERHIGSARVGSGGGTAPYSYIWSQGQQVLSSPDSVTGLYGDSSVTVFIMDSHGCADTLSGAVSNTPGPSARIADPDTICVTESNGVLVVEPTSNDGPFTYRWSSGSTTTVAGGLPRGVYTVTVTNAAGCDTVLGARIEGYNAFMFLYASTGTIYQGQTASLAIQTNVPVKDVDWLPYIAGSAGSTEAYDKPKETTQYTAILTYGQACKLYDTAIVYVLLDTSKMVVPNTFTPNGDGINDDFNLIAYQATVQSFHIWVYDRWGNKVYESTDVNFHWDGSDIFVANKPLNTGVFSYAIEYSLASEREKRTMGGNISLVK